MKRVFTSAGIVGIGVLGLCNGMAQEEKPWNLKANLRTFYDDNYGTLNSANTAKDDSFGIDVNPVGTYKAQTGPTKYQVEYDYRLRFFEGRSNNKTDNQHLISLQLANQFADDWNLRLNNRFSYAQEPGVNGPGGLVIAPVKTQGSYVRNNVTAVLSHNVSDTEDASLTYRNTVSDFQGDGVGSRSALLDMVGHQLKFAVNTELTEVTKGTFGYTFGLDSMTSDDPLANVASGATRTILPEERDRRYHHVYVGASHSFTDDFRMRANVGVELSEYPNAAATSSRSQVNPWAESKADYLFTQDSKASLGVKHERAGTDVAFNAANPGTTTTDSQVTTVFGSYDRRISGPVFGSLVFQVQNTAFSGGTADGSSDQLYTGGLTFRYEIMPQSLDAELGYALDRLDSDLSGRSFTRHRTFLGVKYRF